MEKNFTEKEIEYLKSKGFKQDDNLHSGYYFIDDEDSNRTTILVPLLDGSWKLECYEELMDHEGAWYTDYSKTFSAKYQTLEQFIEQEIG